MKNRLFNPSFIVEEWAGFKLKMIIPSLNTNDLVSKKMLVQRDLRDIEGNRKVFL